MNSKGEHVTSYTVAYVFGTFKGTHRVEAPTEEQALRIVQAWARENSGLPVAFEPYRVIVARRLDAEQRRAA